MICPAEKIPDEIVVDLDNTEIGTSIKISSVKLPENIAPTITDRDFVIATVVAPTIVIEPEKTEEATAEGEAAVEGAVEGEVKEGAAATDDKKEEGKEKSTKPADDKSKGTSADKGQSQKKETKKK